MALTATGRGNEKVMGGHVRGRRDAFPTIDPQALTVSALIGPDRRVQAVTLRASTGGVAVEIDLSPDVPSLLQFAENVITIAEGLSASLPDRQL